MVCDGVWCGEACLLEGGVVGGGQGGTPPCRRRLFKKKNLCFHTRIFEGASGSAYSWRQPAFPCLPSSSATLCWRDEQKA